MKADVFEQIELLALGVVEHQLGPGVVDCFPCRAQLKGQARIQVGQRLTYDILWCGQPLKRARSAGGDSRGWVDPYPATAFDPDFCPGVGIALPDGPKTIDRILLTALVARDDPGGYIECAHQNDKARGYVLAKTFFFVKPELVGRVLPVHTGLQGVGIAAGAQLVYSHIHQRSAARLGIAGITPDFIGQCQRSRVKAGRQLNKLTQGNASSFRTMREAGVALYFVAQLVIQRAIQLPLQIWLHQALVARQNGALHGSVHDHQPRPAVGLQRYFIVDGRTTDHQAGGDVER